jgi:hypothetical protein
MSIPGDVVGSLLRPPYLVKAREAFEASRMSPSAPPSPGGEVTVTGARGGATVAGGRSCSLRSTSERRSIGRQSCQAQGVEAVVLAGTDLFLAFEGYECGFPVIDSAQVHVNALFRESLKEAPGRGRP